MQILVAITFIVLLTAGGDYLLKVGSSYPRPFLAIATHAGAVLYLASSYFWIYVMQRTNLTVIGAAYSALMIVVLTIMSLFVFKEHVTARQLVGAGLAFTSTLFLIDFSKA